MRKNILFLSAAIVFAACADDQQTTAPHGPRSGASSRSADLPPGPGAASRSLDLPPGPGAGARPADQVGWTKAITVYSTPHPVAPGTSGFASATCPAGTTLVGGGYTLDIIGATVAPVIAQNTPGIGSVGWNAGVTNLNAAGGAYVSVTSIARCAS